MLRRAGSQTVPRAPSIITDSEIPLSKVRNARKMTTLLGIRGRLRMQKTSRFGHVDFESQ